MINVVYLVLLVTSNSSSVGSVISVPQANMAQCQINAKEYKKESNVDKAYCIVGVK